MEPKDLVKIWTAPDHSQLTPKQISLRLPIQVAAKISALCDMYPRKTKTEIIGDLLATALGQLEDSLEFQNVGRSIDHPETGEEIFESYCGPLKDFRTLTEKHLKKLEAELEAKVK